MAKTKCALHQDRILNLTKLQAIPIHVPTYEDCNILQSGSIINDTFVNEKDGTKKLT